MATAEQVVREWAARLDAGDLDGSSDLVVDDVEWANPVASVHGRDELRGLLGVFWTAIPDFQHDISDIVASGDRVALRGLASARIAVRWQPQRGRYRRAAGRSPSTSRPSPASRTG
jgi:ketosteroid isomerase-like protein